MPEYLFCYLKIAVVMRKQAKATNIIMSYKALDRIPNNYHCFRNNKWQM